MLAPQQSAIPRIFVISKEYLPYLISIPALILSFAFRLSREFNQLLFLLLLHWVLFHFVWHNPYKLNINKTFLLYTIAILLPINIIVNNVLKERGIISRHGLFRLLGIILLALLIILILWLGNKTMHRPLNISLFPSLKIKGLLMPQLALLGFIVAGFFIVVKSAFNITTFNLNQIVFVIACALAIQFSRHELYGTLFLSVAALTILVATLLNSYSLAYLDELTGLPSRRALKQELSSQGKRYSVAMLDIDHFKKLNDTYGHDVGDQILKMVASRIRRVPGAGKTFRYGGEEFTVIFPNKTLAEAHLIAKEICKAIAKSAFVLRGKRRAKKKPPFITKAQTQKKIDVTISIGVAQKTGHHKTPQDAVKAADRALYRAKDAGRNRACT